MDDAVNGLEDEHDTMISREMKSESQNNWCLWKNMLKYEYGCIISRTHHRMKKN
jgi:hypothetical protein